TLDGDEPLFVDVDDVAGVVPAFGRRLEYTRPLGPKIAEHHVGPAQDQPAAFVHTLDFFEPGFHAGQYPPDAAELVEHWRVERERGRGFGHAVTLENTQPELFHVGLARRFLQWLGAAENVAQRAEVIGVRDARIAVQEGVGPEHDRGVHAVD